MIEHFKHSQDGAPVLITVHKHAARGPNAGCGRPCFCASWYVQFHVTWSVYFTPPLLLLLNDSGPDALHTDLRVKPAPGQIVLAPGQEHTCFLSAANSAAPFPWAALSPGHQARVIKQHLLLLLLWFLLRWHWCSVIELLSRDLLFSLSLCVWTETFGFFITKLLLINLWTYGFCPSESCWFFIYIYIY